MPAPSPSRLFLAVLLGWLAVDPGTLPAQTAPVYYFTHLAGPRGGPGNADGPKDIARFNGPGAVAVDPQGNVYVTDTVNRAIRKISPAGVVSKFADIFQPSGIATDLSGNVYVADSNRDTIYKISPAGSIATLAGAPYSKNFNSFGPIGINRDGTGADARFHQPSGLAVDASGNVYVADTLNGTIRRITPDGLVTTIAGDPAVTGNDDGQGSAAHFNRPVGVAIDASGAIYVSDVRSIRRLSPGGLVTTLFGNGLPAGTATAVGTQPALGEPRIAVTPAGTLYAAERINGVIRQITSTGTVTILAGDATAQPGFAEGIGAAARFNRPLGLAVDATGNLLVADSENDVIRQVSTTGTVSTYAGRAGGAGFANGPAEAAQFNQPAGVAMDSGGNLFIADSGNNRVRKITPGGEVSTFTGATGEFRQPNGVAIGPTGTVYSADAGRDRVAINLPDGTATTLAGGPPGLVDGPLAAARFHWPLGLAVGRTGIIYVADTANQRIRRISTDGVVSTLTNAVDAPNGVAVDDAGNVYVADRHLAVVLKVTPAGLTSVLAGSPNQVGTTVDGQGSAARFNGPCGVTVDRQGNVFVADTDGNTIRRITPDGTVTTLGGQPGVYGSADGVGGNAHFYAPHGITVTDDGTLYITEEWNHAIRVGRPAGPPVITTQPRNLTVAPGGAVQFSVNVAAVPDATYQWYVDGQPFTGATSSTLSFASARAADAGRYQVVVTNSLGSVTSNAVTLTVSAGSGTPPPSGGGTSGSGSGGGGGAPSLWFLAALGAAAGRRLFGRVRAAR